MIDHNFFRYLLILFVYLEIAILLTLPAIFHFTTHVIGDYGDTFQNLWNFWFIKEKIEKLDLNLFYTKLQFYPEGVDLSFHTFSLINSIFYFPLAKIIGLIPTYNLSLLLSLALAGFAMFLLVKYLIDDEYIAFIAGTFYAFSPYQFAHLLGTHIFNMIQWIPFYTLFFLKTFQSESKINPILAGLFFTFTTLSNYRLGIYLLIFSILLSLFFWRKIIEKIKLLLLISLVIIVTLLPLLFKAVYEYFHEEYMKTELNNLRITINLINYFLPSPFNFAVGKFVRPFHKECELAGGLADCVVNIPFTVLGVSFLSFLVAKKFKNLRGWIIFLWGCLLLFLILSLGPVTPVYKLFYYYFPFFDGLTHPARFALMVSFLSSLLFGYGMKLLLLVSRNRKRIVLTSVAGLLLFELCSIPITLSDARMPSIMYKISRENNITILNIPETHASLALYFQTAHNKKIIGGYVARVPEESLVTLNKLREYIANRNTEMLKKLLNDLRVKYIFKIKIVYLPVKSQLQDIFNLLELEKIYEDEKVTVWKVLN